MGKGFVAGRALCLHRLAVEPLIARARHISCGNEGPIQTTGLGPGARGSGSQVLTGDNSSVDQGISTKITLASSANYLGLTIDFNANFTMYIGKVSSKHDISIIFLLRRLSYF